MDDNQNIPNDTTPPAEGESGQGLAEYAFILLLIAIAAVAALGALGSAIANSPGFKLLS